MTYFGRISSILRQHKLLVLLVAFDFLTKNIFFILLPLREAIQVIPGFMLILQPNEHAFGTSTRGIFGDNVLPTILISVFSFIVSILVFFVKKKKWKTFNKVFFCCTVWWVLWIISYLVSAFIHVEWDNVFVVSVIGRFGLVFLVLVVYSLIKDRYFRSLFAFLAASGLGNFLSNFYPPFIIVDFMYSEIFRIIFRLHVCNFADLYNSIAIYMVFFSAVYLIWKSRKEKRERKMKAASSG